MDIISSAYQKARKIHICDYCGGSIAIGEKYERTLIKGDYLYPWKSHLKCLEIASKLKMHDDCDDGVTSDDFYEIISEKYRQLQSDVNEYPHTAFLEQLDFVCKHFNIN